MSSPLMQKLLLEFQKTGTMCKRLLHKT